MQTLFRWTGATVFLISLLSFPIVYLFRLRIPAPDDGHALRDGIANVILFTVFALHHSLMARSGAKAWIARVVGPDLERSVYVWIASLLYLAVCLLWRPLPGMVWQVGGLGAAVMLIAQLLGVYLTVDGARLVGVWELAGVRQPDRTKVVEFSTTGPFGVVRHPIYLGWVLMVFPAPVMTTSLLLFAVVSTAYLIAAIPFEERSLVDAHGEKYRSYQRQMKWRLIPRVW